MKLILTTIFKLLKQLTLLLLVLYTCITYSQDRNEQIEFKIDNDKFLFIDRYYTSGLFITYKKQLENDFIFNNIEDNKLQLNLILGNETYTPTDLSSFNSSRFDRPFAGWFYGSIEIVKIKSRSALFLALEGGVTGDASLSGSLQQGFHDLFSLGNRPTWAEQIGFKVLFNFKLKYIYNWQLNKNNVFQIITNPALGTKDIFFSNEVKYVFGKFNVFNKTSGIGAIDNSLNNEFFGFIGLGHKYVIHNTLLQGGITRNETTFTASPTRNVYKLDIGSTLKIKRNTYKLVYSFNTKETRLSSSHGYGSFTYARSF